MSISTAPREADSLDIYSEPSHVAPDLVTMADSWALNAGRRRNMQANRNRDTKPELRLRSLLHRRGLRFRVAYRPLHDVRWTADIVFTKAHIAVFVDGCFWHGCPAHFKMPSRNTQYWAPKIERNRWRDEEFDRLLLAADWIVVRMWAHQSADDMVRQVEKALELAKSNHRFDAQGFRPRRRVVRLDQAGVEYDLPRER